MSKNPATLMSLYQKAEDLEKRMDRGSNEFKDLRVELAAHAKVDLEQFDDQRKCISEVKEAVFEIKLMMAEHMVDSESLVGIKRDIESLKLTRAGTKPWIDMLIKMIWALLGAGVAWLLSHGGLSS